MRIYKSLISNPQWHSIPYNHAPPTPNHPTTPNTHPQPPTPTRFEINSRLNFSTFKILVFEVTVFSLFFLLYLMRNSSFEIEADLLDIFLVVNGSHLFICFSKMMCRLTNTLNHILVSFNVMRVFIYQYWIISRQSLWQE